MSENKSVFVLSTSKDRMPAHSGSSFVLKPFSTKEEIKDYIAKSLTERGMRDIALGAVKELKVNKNTNIGDFTFALVLTTVLSGKDVPPSQYQDTTKLMQYLQNYQDFNLITSPRDGQPVVIKEVLGVYVSLEDAAKDISSKIDLNNFVDLKIELLKPHSKPTVRDFPNYSQFGTEPITAENSEQTEKAPVTVE